MTTKEAIECLEVLEMALGDGKKYAPIQMAVQALEKQIPKKPIYKTFDTGDTIAYKCPNCHKKNFDDGKLLGDYCPYCGQRLDWSENND